MDKQRQDTGRTGRLSELAPEVASTVVQVAGDIALVIGQDGVIRNVAAGTMPGSGQHWVGVAWADTVSAPNRGKAEALLHEAREHGLSRRRELNHPAQEGGEIPMSWAAVRLGDGGPLLAVGRDLRAVSAIQQRFLDAQQALERDYWQRRNAETQYRLLFQVAHDGVLVLDAESGAVLDANPAANGLLGQAEPAWAEQSLHRYIDPSLQPLLDELLVTARATGRAAEVRLRAALSGLPLDVSATPFRSGHRHCLLLRVRRAEPSSLDALSVADFIGQTPDAVVVTDAHARVLWANPAFLALCQAPDESTVKGYGLPDVLGDPAHQWQALLARVRARGVVGHATLELAPSGVEALSVDVSAALLAEGDQEHIGLTLRRRSDTRPSPRRVPDGLALDLAALNAQVGQAPLADLLAEASRLIESHFIQAALHAAGDRLDMAAHALRIDAAVLLQRMDLLGMPVPLPVGHEGLPPLVN